MEIYMAEKTQDKKIVVDSIEYIFNEDYVDDMEVLELSDKVQSEGGITAYPALLRKLIGDEKYKEASDHYKEKNGRFKVTDAQAIFDAIIKAVDPKD